MKHASEKHRQDSATVQYSRRRFLKRALLTAAYVAPVVVSYPRSVFANHCTQQTCGGKDHKFQGMTWSPGCSVL